MGSKRNFRQQVEQNTIVICNEKELQLVYQIWKVRKNDPFIVNLLRFELFNQGKLGVFSILGGMVYNERIPLRLTHLKNIPFPDWLHLYSQAIYGFQKLIPFFGYFIVNQNCIGVNEKHVVKVWHNPNFAHIHPFETAFSEYQMINSILMTIERCIDGWSMPQCEINFRNFMSRELTTINFQVLKRKFIEYVRYFNNGEIPRYLVFVQAKGGAEKIRWKNQECQNEGGGNKGNNSGKTNIGKNHCNGGLQKSFTCFQNKQQNLTVKSIPSHNKPMSAPQNTHPKDTTYQIQHSIYPNEPIVRIIPQQKIQSSTNLFSINNARKTNSTIFLDINNFHNQKQQIIQTPQKTCSISNNSINNNNNNTNNGYLTSSPIPEMCVATPQFISQTVIKKSSTFQNGEEQSNNKKKNISQCVEPIPIGNPINNNNNNNNNNAHDNNYQNGNNNNHSNGNGNNRNNYNNSIVSTTNNHNRKSNIYNNNNNNKNNGFNNINNINNINNANNINNVNNINNSNNANNINNVNNVNNINNMKNSNHINNSNNINNFNNPNNINNNNMNINNKNFRAISSLLPAFISGSNNVRNLHRDLKVVTKNNRTLQKKLTFQPTNSNKQEIIENGFTDTLIQSPYFSHNHRKHEILPQSRKIQNMTDIGDIGDIGLSSRNSQQQSVVIQSRQLPLQQDKTQQQQQQPKSSQQRVHIKKQYSSVSEQLGEVRDKNQIELTKENDSQSSINPGGITHEKVGKRFNDVREAESINNSVRFFGNSLFNDQCSQVLELSSQLDFRLSNRHQVSIKQFKKQQPGNDQLAASSSSKIFGQKKGNDNGNDNRVENQKNNKSQRLEKRTGGHKRYWMGEREIKEEDGKFGSEELSSDDKKMSEPEHENITMGSSVSTKTVDQQRNMVFNSFSTSMAIPKMLGFTSSTGPSKFDLESMRQVQKEQCSSQSQTFGGLVFKVGHSQISYD